MHINGALSQDTENTEDIAILVSGNVLGGALIRVLGLTERENIRQITAHLTLLAMFVGKW
ncbi:MAG: hypothetical protein P8Y67_00660 [Alphaproteobacteria bacterium]